jgi:hypothetical protein
MRLNVDSTLKDQSGGLIRCSYTGVMNLSPATGAVLTGHPDAKTTDYGDAGRSWRCELCLLRYAN